ncbi:MAG: cell division protein ZapA [Deltaproteobacteria bacterium]|nr:cell division protein ZapA [Deltaproteobacteria bacterium]
MKQPVEIEIMGHRITVASEDGEVHVREAAQLVDLQMRQLASAQPPTSTVQLALLAALNLASECWKLREQREASENMIDRLSRRMLERLSRLTVGVVRKEINH